MKIASCVFFGGYFSYFIFFHITPWWFTDHQHQSPKTTMPNDKGLKDTILAISVQYWNAFHGADGNFRYLHHCPISPDALCGIAQLILETIYHLNLLILPMLQRAQKWFLRSQKQIASLFYLLHAFVIYVNLGILIQADSPLFGLYACLLIFGCQIVWCVIGFNVSLAIVQSSMAAS